MPTKTPPDANSGGGDRERQRHCFRMSFPHPSDLTVGGPVPTLCMSGVGPAHAATLCGGSLVVAQRGIIFTPRPLGVSGERGRGSSLSLEPWPPEPRSGLPPSPIGRGIGLTLRAFPLLTLQGRTRERSI